MNADEDIKIFDPERDEKLEERRTDDDLRRLADEMMAQRRNGNSRRACLLGSALSQLAPCDGELLATTAINAFYEKLMVRAPEFYSNISDGGAFTFYYLELRKGGNTGANIGKAFAMLCDMETNEQIRALGTQIYETFSEYLKRQIDAAGCVR